MMIKLKVVRLILNFYMSFFITTFALTLISGYLLSILGMTALTLIFWFKVVTMGIIVYYINSYKHKEFFYYQNLGISKAMLWISSLTLDFLIFVVLVSYLGSNNPVNIGIN